MAQRKKKCWKILWSLLGIGQFYLRWIHTDFGDKHFIHSIFLSSLKRNTTYLHSFKLEPFCLCLGNMYEFIFVGILLNANSGMYNLLTIYILVHIYYICSTLLHIPSSMNCNKWIGFFYESCWRLKRGQGPFNQAHYILNVSST